MTLTKAFLRVLFRAGCNLLDAERKFCQAAFESTKEHLIEYGINHLLWGSDYPYTGCKDMPQHCEYSQDYGVLMKRLVLVAHQRAILQNNPSEVFGLPLARL